MSSFFADENSIVCRSPNLLEVPVENDCKPVVGIIHVPTALFMSPMQNSDSKCSVKNDTPLSEEGDNSSSVQNSDRKPLVENEATLLEDVDSVPLVETSSSTTNVSDSVSAESNETDEQRIRRENEESERLCWEMMREESENAYRVQMEFINSSSNGMSAEDLEAIQMAMNHGNNFVPDEVDEERGDDDEVYEEEKEQEQSDVDQWDYDRLLALSEEIGDVKTERWRLKSKAVISKLPKISYTEMKQRQMAVTNTTSSSSSSSSSSSNCNKSTIQDSSAAASTTVIDDASSSPKHKRVRHDPSCAICMEVFIGDDGLNVLPCQHYFHQLCTEGWLADHNSCPMCKTLVSATP